MKRFVRLMKTFSELSESASMEAKDVKQDMPEQDAARFEEWQKGAKAGSIFRPNERVAVVCTRTR